MTHWPARIGIILGIAVLIAILAITVVRIRVNTPPLAETVETAAEAYLAEEEKPEEEPEELDVSLSSWDWDSFTWDRETFVYLREPLYLAEYTPHGELALQHIRFINDNLYSRKPFSYREKEAAAWLVEELLAMGHPWEQIQVQEFVVDLDSRWRNLTTAARFASDFAFRETTRLSQNVILTIPGESEGVIIVGAHYDSWPTPGASDNASGTSLLLESAQRMLELENYYTIVYVFFGAEEIGMQGSLHYALNLTEEEAENIVLMINADVLLEGPYLFYGAAYDRDGHPGENALTRQIDAIADALDFGLIADSRVAYLSSDQLPFIMRGHTVVVLSGFDKRPLGEQGFIPRPGGCGSSMPGPLFPMGDYQALTQILHTTGDCYHFIEATWPGMIQENMQAFSVFLEEMVLMR